MTVRYRGSSWQADLMLGGTRHRYSFTSKEAAEDWEHSARIAHKRGQEVVPPSSSSAPRSGITLRQAVELAYEKRWCREGAATAEKQRMNALCACQFFGDDRLLSSITTPDLMQYTEHLHSSCRNGGGTINRKLSALSVTFKAAVEWGHIQVAPQMPKRRKEGNPRMRYLDHKEQEDIAFKFRWMGYPQYADLLDFLIASGLRITEATSLKWDDVNLQKNTVTLRATKNGDRDVVQAVAAKGMRALAAQDRAQSGPWSNIKQDHLRRKLQDVCDILGIKDVVIHTTRHTTASRLVQAGVDIARVQRFMRHKTIAMTMRYAKLGSADMDMVADML